MAEVKWIKLMTDMFDDEKIDYIQSLPEGDSILIIWIRLLTMAGKCNAGGYIFLTENIPYTIDALAHKFKKPESIIKLAFSTFTKLGMIELIENGPIFISNFTKYQNIEGLEKIKQREKEKLKKRKQREKLKELPPENNKEPNNVPGTIPGQSPGTPSYIRSRSKNIDLDNTVVVDLTIDHRDDNITTNYYKFFNENFHPITDFERQELESFEADGLTPGAIVMALKEAIDSNVRNMKFVKAVLHRYLDNNLLTVEAINADKENHKRKNKDTKSNAKINSKAYKPFGE
ncbi:phage replisome organizer N-terminal domain-containing protein [Clostridium kluyveri]|uniref:Phage replisome organiser N-terminal domain-containing protein n=1 Tax=Clostridium kluyveri TaxID=1534 RepID=A0A1L5F8T3_CLOKL|nr:phage replisome organizer N-terminal domain-containing protein [Clostridium kluyveri]APM39425.1 hypothetical protein BS101_12065 [Clostridium kluyveri]